MKQDKNTTERVQWSTLLNKKKHIKPKDVSGLIPVKIDDRTTILVKPGADIEAIKLKYKNYKINP